MSSTRYMPVVTAPGDTIRDNDDEPVLLFATPGEAWDQLASWRREAEDDAMPDDSEYSTTVHELDTYGVTGHGAGTITACAPGNPDVQVSYAVVALANVDENESDESDQPDLAGDGGVTPWQDSGTGVTLA